MLKEQTGKVQVVSFVFAFKELRTAGFSYRYLALGGAFGTCQGRAWFLVFEPETGDR
jgi:hypothetical protein